MYVHVILYYPAFSLMIIVKLKAVPLHTREELGKRGRIAPTHS
jgi:hypothetical protein